MDNSSTAIRRLPTRIDRYPGKMVSHLAQKLVDRYAPDADHLFDPFCGSGAVLAAGCNRNIPVSGADINPFAVLLSKVKIEGFRATDAIELCEHMLLLAKRSSNLPMRWDNKGYWFSSATLHELERIRRAAKDLNLYGSKPGRAVLLSLGLSARLCSRADQRSPKPYISKLSRKERGTRYFDPAQILRELLTELANLYGEDRNVCGNVYHLSVADLHRVYAPSPECSHVITSPPYINAQDYFRNSKLELYLLEGLLPFQVDDIIQRFIGTERGVAPSLSCDPRVLHRRHLIPELSYLETHHPRQASVIHRYIRDMETAFRSIKSLLKPRGTFVLVCGDNLVGNRLVVTWKALSDILESLGFSLVDRFEDRIRNRALAPGRKGHRGLIKQEVVSAFRL